VPASTRRGHDGHIDTVRIDVWLWSIRLFKTRSAATDAVKGGHVRVNGKPVKPASPVRVGDEVEAFVHDRHRVLGVVQLLDKRVAAPVAALAIDDRSPAPVERDPWEAPVFERERGAGRPTKRDRRTLDRFRGG
jgi:ribosome-associated heat shock protein Hsp15